jgi:hypothetical protein
MFNFKINLSAYFHVACLHIFERVKASQFDFIDPNMTHI